MYFFFLFKKYQKSTGHHTTFTFSLILNHRDTPNIHPLPYFNRIKIYTRLITRDTFFKVISYSPDIKKVSF